VQKQREYEKAGNVLSDRDKIWNVSIEAARYFPVFGLGISNWHFIKIEDLKKSVEARNEIFDPEKYSIKYGHSHNLFLTILVERGWVGFIVFLWFMNAWALALIKAFKEAKTNYKFGMVWAGALSAWLGIFGIGLVNTTMHHEHGILSWLFLGLFLNSLLSIKAKN
jgi:O-antigen ligase